MSRAGPTPSRPAAVYLAPGHRGDPQGPRHPAHLPAAAPRVRRDHRRHRLRRHHRCRLRLQRERPLPRPQFDTYGEEGLTATFIVRCIMGPFGHPLFTCAHRHRHRHRRHRAPAPSRVSSPCSAAGSARCSCTASGTSRRSPAWTASSRPTPPTRCRSSSPSSASSCGLRRREGRLIGQYLSPYADAGWLTHGGGGDALLLRCAGREGRRAWASRRHAGQAVDERVPGQRERPRPAPVADRPRHRREGRCAARARPAGGDHGPSAHSIGSPVT